MYKRTINYELLYVSKEFFNSVKCSIYDIITMRVKKVATDQMVVKHVPDTQHHSKVSSMVQKSHVSVGGVRR